MTIARRAVLIVLASALGCSDSTGTNSIASVTILPLCTVLQVNESCVLTAHALDAAGAVTSGPKTTWSSSAPGVLRVTSSGRASALAAGSSIVTATIAGRAGTMTMQVIPTVFSWRATAAAPTVVLGSTDQMSLVLYDVHDNPISVSLPTLWTVNDSALATVNAAGLLTPLKEGFVIVTAAFVTGGSLAPLNASTVVYIVQPPAA